MILFPPAKINLGLQIVAKRSDGYHEIASCVLPIPLFDILEILPSESFKFVQSGQELDAQEEDNLVVKAWRLLQERRNIPPVYLHLRKQLPTGAGLGGGSADAAYVLRGLNDLFDLKLSNEDLRALAAELGSDCPFFIEDHAQLARGRGELLEAIDVDVKGWFLKLVFPEIHVSTAQAYAGVQPAMPSLDLMEIVKKSPTQWRKELHNDFEDSVFTAFPEIAGVKEFLYQEGAVYASMSGSGSAVFGLYQNRPEASAPMGKAWVMEL